MSYPKGTHKNRFGRLAYIFVWEYSHDKLTVQKLLLKQSPQTISRSARSKQKLKIIFRVSIKRAIFVELSCLVQNKFQSVLANFFLTEYNGGENFLFDVIPLKKWASLD